METDRLKVSLSGGVCTLTLHRPEVHNAFNAELIADLTKAFQSLSKDSSVRVVLLTSEGKNFCAGADLNWMKSTVNFTRAQNEKDALKMHKMLESIYMCPKPTIAKVRGIAFGGGVGLIAAVDAAVCSTDATFSLSEVRLGILPAVISPFVLRKIGMGAFRAYGLSAKRMTSTEAIHAGLVQEDVEPHELDAAAERWVQLFLSNAPGAMAALKTLTHQIQFLPLSQASKKTVPTIAKARAGAEGQEGMKSFLEKRKPNW